MSGKFDHVPGASIGSGAVGVVRCGTVLVATLTEWRAVESPYAAVNDQGEAITVTRPVLYATGSVLRYWTLNQPRTLTAYLTPSPTPYRLGQKRPPVPKPFRIVGTVYSLTPTGLVLNEGTITYGVLDERPTARRAHEFP